MLLLLLIPRADLHAQRCQEKKQTSVHKISCKVSLRKKKQERNIHYLPSSCLKQNNKVLFYWLTFTWIMYKPCSRGCCSGGSQVTLQIWLNYPSLWFCLTVRWSWELRFQLLSITQEIGILTFTLPKQIHHPSLMPIERKIQAMQLCTMKSNFPHLTFFS